KARPERWWPIWTALPETKSPSTPRWPRTPRTSPGGSASSIPEAGSGAGRPRGRSIPFASTTAPSAPEKSSGFARRRRRPMAVDRIIPLVIKLLLGSSLVLAVAALVLFYLVKRDPRAAAARSDLAELQRTVEAYRSTTGRYPETIKDLFST